MNELRKRNYEDRQADERLNSLLFDKVESFINSVSGDLANMGYEIEVAGSLRFGEAIHMRGSKLIIKDIDFFLTKSGEPLPRSEAMSLKRNSWFKSEVKSFLRELKTFYDQNGITIKINEADFIYNRSGWFPKTFAIGMKSLF